MHAHFEKPFNKLKNVTSEPKTYLKTSQFYVWISILYLFLNFDFRFQIWFLFSKFI